jgi:hypothetical protein
VILPSKFVERNPRSDSRNCLFYMHKLQKYAVFTGLVRGLNKRVAPLDFQTEIIQNMFFSTHSFYAFPIRPQNRQHH